MKTTLKASAVQMVSCDCVDTNLAAAEKLIAKAASQSAQLVVLPEYFAIMPSKSSQRVEAAESELGGKVQEFLSTMAKKYNLWIVGGSHPVKSQNDSKRFWGRCCVYNHLGEEVGFYNKIHLFDVDVSDSHKSYRESDYTLAGNQPMVFDSPWGKIGVAICYDIRFPEMFRQLVDLGANIIVFPAAFTQVTGKAHWHCLIKARAIENLCFMVASAQGGLHSNGRETYGHSLITSPWGDTLAEIEKGEGVITAELNLKQVEKIRSEFPALSHRRL